MGKKAVASIIYMLIIGLLMFILVSCAIGHGAMKAFKSYKGVEKSFDNIGDALSEVANKSNGIAVKLVLLEMEEDTALFIFQKDTDLILGVESYDINGFTGKKILIEKPIDCPYNEQCLCLCTDFKLNTLSDGKNSDELNAKYAGKYPGIAPVDMNSIECAKNIECKISKDFEIPSHTSLSEVVSQVEYDRIKQKAKSQNHKNDQTFINYWEGGFVLWRFSDSQKIFQPDQFMSSKYVDLFVVNNDVNVKLCLDPDCGKIKNP